MTRHLTFSSSSRRQFLIGGSATTLSATALALLTGIPKLALGESRAPDAAADAGTLNTALALEHEGIAAYTLGAKSNLLRQPALTMAIKFQNDHKAHRDRLIQVIRSLGANPVEEKSLAEYATALEVDKLKSQTDLLNFAANLEDGAVNAYLGIIPAFQDRQLAKLAGQLAADETEHYSLLAHALSRPLPAPLSFGA